MPNRSILEEVAAARQKKRPAAERAYRRYQHEVPRLIRDLAGPTQAQYDRAFRLLTRMGDTIVAELLAALADPTLDPVADDVVSLLGNAGHPRAVPVLWDWFQAHLTDADRASTAMLTLAALGNDRVLPYVRAALNMSDEEMVSNAVTSLYTIGELEDIDRLRIVHRRFLGNSEIRAAVATAIVSILGETSEATLKKTLDQIEASPADKGLWADIFRLLQEMFG